MLVRDATVAEAPPPPAVSTDCMPGQVRSPINPTRNWSVSCQSPPTNTDPSRPWPPLSRLAEAPPALALSLLIKRPAPPATPP